MSPICHGAFVSVSSPFSRDTCCLSEWMILFVDNSNGKGRFIESLRVTGKPQERLSSTFSMSGESTKGLCGPRYIKHRVGEWGRRI